MNDPYLASDDASALQKPGHIGKWNGDTVSLISAIALAFAAPTAMLAAYLFLPKDAPLPKGRWPHDTMNDHIIQVISIAHLVLGLAGVIIIWLIHSKILVKIVFTILALASVVPMLFAFIVVTLEKTNKLL